MKKILSSLAFITSSLLANPIATIETTVGTIDISLRPDIAPLAVENFTKLSQKGYYTQTTFHRVIKKFMIQGGDPQGNGTGGESIWKKPFKDEFSPKALFDSSGVLAMANRGANTNGSQFFITTAPTPWLNGYHTIFGKVIKGENVLKAIENSPTDSSDKPKTPIKILKITIH